MLVVPDLTISNCKVVQPIAGPSFPPRTFYSAHPATQAANRAQPPAQFWSSSLPCTQKGKRQMWHNRLRREVIMTVVEALQLLLQQLMHHSLVIMIPILATHSLVLLLLSLIRAAQLVCTSRVLTSETKW